MIVAKISDNTIKVVLAVLLISFAVTFRLLPHPPNFAPIAAVALFGGALLPKGWGLSLPLLAMIVSDLVIGLHPLILFTWGSFLIIALFGNKFLRTVNPANIVGASLASSVFFFIITNFGVWIEGRLYPLTAEGLLNSYVNAIPFFRNTLMSDLVFSSLLFGSYVFVYKYVLHRTGSLRVLTVSAGQ